MISNMSDPKGTYQGHLGFFRRRQSSSYFNCPCRYIGSIVSQRPVEFAGRYHHHFDYYACGPGLIAQFGDSEFESYVVEFADKNPVFPNYALAMALYDSQEETKEIGPDTQVNPRYNHFKTGPEHVFFGWYGKYDLWYDKSRMTVCSVSPATFHTLHISDAKKREGPIKSAAIRAKNYLTEEAKKSEEHEAELEQPKYQKHRHSIFLGRWTDRDHYCEEYDLYLIPHTEEVVARWGSDHDNYFKCPVYMEDIRQDALLEAQRRAKVFLDNENHKKAAKREEIHKIAREVGCGLPAAGKIWHKRNMMEAAKQAETVDDLRDILLEVLNKVL